MGFAHWLNERRQIAVFYYNIYLHYQKYRKNILGNDAKWSSDYLQKYSFKDWLSNFLQNIKYNIKEN